MGLFGIKKEMRFETIVIDREKEVFRALEERGWSLCTDPFQFDEQKPAERIRKDAMKTGRDLKAELMVEIYDPLYARTPCKALKYAAWRKATPEEMRVRLANKMVRPSYADTMGSYDEIESRLDQKRILVSTEEMKVMDTVVKQEDVKLEGEVYGGAYEDMGMKKENIEAVRAQSPFEQQGSVIETHASHKGPVFESEIHIETGVPDSADPTKDIDPLVMMMEAAEKAPPPSHVMAQAASQPLPQPGQLPIQTPKPQQPQVHYVGESPPPGPVPLAPTPVKPPEKRVQEQ